jgi:predicted PurR-regulated permease PerM
MSFPSPTEKQARILWVSITALAVAVLLALVGVFILGMAWVVNRLSSVLLPLAVAGIIAYLLDPVVDYFERKRMPRHWAILSVFFLAVLLVVALLGTVIPQLVHEIGDLVKNVPGYARDFGTRLSDWLRNSPMGNRAQEIWEEFRPRIQTWSAEAVPVVSGWLFAQMGRAAGWFGLLVGFFLVPVYIFYFLLEKRGIEGRWTDYLPVHESKWKEELVFCIKSVNDNLIVFFRGQVLVAMCVGLLTTLGFFLIGLKYALVLGVMTGVLGIIPYLGVMASIIPAIILGIVQFGDWRVLLVVLVFVIVQAAEGLVISPKIMGDRVRMHPLTIIIAVMVGTTLMGGILGGILAIPLTAVLRTLMFRYVWKRRGGKK